MSKHPNIRSLNDGIADELRLEELEARLELSPIGILDLLLADAHISNSRDAPPNGCSMNNACGDYGCSALA